MRKKSEMYDLSDEELVKIFFESGGIIYEEDFVPPKPTDPKKEEGFFAYQILKNRGTGIILLGQIHDRFLNCEIDEKGNPIEKEEDL